MISEKQNVLLNIYRAYFPSRECENLARFASSRVVYQKLGKKKKKKLEIECTSKPHLLGNLFILINYMLIV